MPAPTADDLEAHARLLAGLARAILLRLAHGKYDGQAAVTKELLRELGIALPPATEIKESLAVFRFLSKLSGPAAGLPEDKSQLAPSIASPCDHTRELVG